jgi:hypothetical protein
MVCSLAAAPPIAYFPDAAIAVAIEPKTVALVDFVEM